MLAGKTGWFGLPGLFDCEPPYPKPEAISFERDPLTASYAAIDLDPPQYDNDGRDERGQH
jgi:hypothetical protein